MKLLLPILLLAFTAFTVQAQDLILRTTGEEIPARVLGITPTEIKYLPIAAAPSTDTLYMATKEVFMIRYANGTKAVLTTPTAPVVTSGRTAEEMTTQGRMDAQTYFKAPGSLFVTATATAVGIIAFGPTTPGALGGLLTGAAIGASPIQDQNIVVPDKTLLNDPNYLAGYQKQAQRKKMGKAAGGLGIGVVTGTIVWLAVALTRTNHF